MYVAVQENSLVVIWTTAAGEVADMYIVNGFCIVIYVVILFINNNKISSSSSTVVVVTSAASVVAVWLLLVGFSLHRLYCTACIAILLSPKAVEQIKNTDPWLCFYCVTNESRDCLLIRRIPKVRKNFAGKLCR